jgi:hypothetical protein
MNTLFLAVISWSVCRFQSLLSKSYICRLEAAWLGTNALAYFPDASATKEGKVVCRRLQKGAGLENFENLFTALDKHMAKLQICSYGLSDTTLEEVRFAAGSSGSFYSSFSRWRDSNP